MDPMDRIGLDRDYNRRYSQPEAHAQARARPSGNNYSTSALQTRAGLIPHGHNQSLASNVGRIDSGSVAGPKFSGHIDEEQEHNRRLAAQQLTEGKRTRTTFLLLDMRFVVRRLVLSHPYHFR